jgi:hypothetical protein
MKFILNLARKIYRSSPAEVAELATAAYSKDLKILNFIFLLITVISITLLSNLLQDRQSNPTVEIKPSQWQVYFSINPSEEACPLKNSDFTSCPSHPLNQSIWSSPIFRGSRQYLAKINKGHSTFWMGTVINKEALISAQKEMANILVINQIEANYEVWVDGEFIYKGNYQQNDLPVMIPLPHSLLQKDFATVAIYVQSNIYSGNLESNNYDIAHDGLYRSEQAEKLARSKYFSGQSRQLVLVSIYILFSIFFYFVYLYNVRNTEYHAVTSFAGTQALFNLMFVDALYRVMSPELWYSLFAAILTSQITITLRFAVNYSRSRRHYDRILYITLLSSFFGSMVLFNNARTVQYFIDFLARYGVPFAYLVGGVLLGLQFLYLSNQKSDEYTSRQENLRVMCTFYFIAAFLIFFQYRSIKDVTTELPMGFLMNIFLFGFLAIKLGKSIKSQIVQLQKIPISKFHKYSSLPKRVVGQILMLDLKNSEFLFRQHLTKNEGSSIMNNVLSHIWALLDESGLTIIQGEGDSILALWPDEENQSSSKKLRVLFDLQNLLNNLHRNLAQQNINMPNGLFFRAAILAGSVKPIWRQAGSDLMAVWIEEGDKNVFVDGSRLLAIEKDLVKEQNTSAIVFLSAFADTIKAATPEYDRYWDVEKVDCLGKHGRNYNVSIFKLNSECVLVDPITKTS